MIIPSDAGKEVHAEVCSGRKLRLLIRRKRGGVGRRAFQSPKEMTAAQTESLSSLHVRVPGQQMRLSQSTQGFGKKTGAEGQVEK